MADGPGDEFDRIVEGLDLGLEFPAEEPLPAPPLVHPSGATANVTPPNRRRAVAWGAVLGAPLLLILATVSGWLLPRSLVAVAALIFVAGSIYLISQLPEHGPGHPDWPDDGAVL